jgi:hypothetical protein
MGPRPCIFTGTKSKHRLEITQDSHSWTRAVPCSKAYLVCREDRKYRDKLLDLEKGMIKEFFQAELRAALSGQPSDFEDLSWVQADQRTIKAILGHEIARYELLDDRSLEKVLEAMIRHRLDGMFPAD